MKSPFALMACLALLTACGQTGPLTMPKPPVRPATAPAQTATPPVRTVTPPAPAAGVVPPITGSGANTIDANTSTNTSTNNGTNNPAPAANQR